MLVKQLSLFGLVLCLIDSFPVSNGVRQGGVMSPLLFNIYINELSVLFNMTPVDCCLGRSIINHRLYADDIVMFTPFAKGLQKLLDVCSNFVAEHVIIFNNTKSQVMFFKAFEPFVFSSMFRVI